MFDELYMIKGGWREMNLQHPLLCTFVLEFSGTNEHEICFVVSINAFGCDFFSDELLSSLHIDQD